MCHRAEKIRRLRRLLPGMTSFLDRSGVVGLVKSIVRRWAA
jgi:hypothetical protein